MMKLTIAALAIALAASWTTGADARDRGVRYYKSKPSKVRVVRKPAGYYRRPSTVAANGLCQRDTGKPDDKLNFRNRCDTEEFWARIEERSSPGRW
jgi:hypothetical protein